jgi:ankyrin repeat protein
MWEGESMQRDGVYWFVCAASRGSVDEARALRAFGCAWDVRLCEIVAENSHVELLKWMCAQRPPCPCDFNACLELAEDEAVRAYFQTGLDLLAMCILPSEKTATVALIDQGADVNVTESDGWTPLHYVCRNGNAEVVKALLKKDADVHVKDSHGWTPLYYVCKLGHNNIAAMLRSKGAVE